MRRASILLALLLIASATPLGMAQTPVDPSVEVTIDTVNAGASLDAPATYTVTVSNTSPGSGSGNDPAMDIALMLTGVPDGWTASLLESNFRVPAGGTASTTLTVAVSGSATDQTATVTVTATIRSGLFPPFELEAEDSDSVTVDRDDSNTREAQEALGDYLWIIVLVGVGFYVLSSALLIALFRKRDANANADKEEVAPIKKAQKKQD